MPMINKGSISRSARSLITLTKNDVMSLVPDGNYFKDSDNWKQVTLHYQSVVNAQNIVVPLDGQTGEGFLNLSPKSMDDFVIKFITIWDFDGGKFIIPRSDLPTADFDISLAPVSVILQDGFLGTNVTSHYIASAGDKVGQRTMLHLPSTVNSIKFNMVKTGSPNADITVKVYNVREHGFSFGGSLSNSAYLVATSNIVDTATIGNSPTAIEFTLNTPLVALYGKNMVNPFSNNWYDMESNYYYEVCVSGSPVLLDESNKIGFVTTTGLNSLGSTYTSAVVNGNANSNDVDYQLIGYQSELPAFVPYTRDFSNPNTIQANSESTSMVIQSGLLVHDSALTYQASYQFNKNQHPFGEIRYRPGKTYRIRVYIEAGTNAVSGGVYSLPLFGNTVSYNVINAAIGSYLEYTASASVFENTPVYFHLTDGVVKISKFEIFEV